MSVGIISLLASLGVGGWVYNKMYHRTGGNTKSALTVAVIVGAIIMLLMFTILHTILPN